MMEFKKHTLENGLTIVGEVNPSAKSTAVGYFVKTGSRDETKDMNGVSHFLEHMLFKGTETLDALSVNEAFDRTGAQFNAFTNEENTVYYAAVLPEYLLEVTALWSQLMRPALRDDDFNMEKNVIKEEIAMYQDLPQFDVMDRCRNLHFDGHPCGNSVLGTVESINALTAEQMRHYFAHRYAPNNISLVVVGNFDFDAIVELADKQCASWQSFDAPREISDHTGSKKTDKLNKANLMRTHICLTSRAVSFQDERRYAASLFNMIVGDSVGSRYFWELVDNAVAETATIHYEAMDGTGAFYSYIRCGSDNYSKVMDIVAKIFDDLQKNGINEDELQKAKNKILSAMVIKDETPMGRLLEVGFNWQYLNEYHTIEENINAIKSVTRDQVNRLIDQLKPGSFTQFTISPDK